MGPWVPNSCSAPSRLSVPAEGTGTSLAGIYPLTQGSEEQERVQQPETGSAAGRKSSWSSSAGQGRAGHTSLSLGPGGMPRAGGRAQPDQDRAQPNSSKGKPWGSGCGGGKTGFWELGWGRLQHLEGAGKERVPAVSKGPWAPTLGLPAARTGSLVPWGVLHLGVSPELHSSVSSKQASQGSSSSRGGTVSPSEAPGSATQCRGLADGDLSPPANPCPRLPCR